MEDTGRKNVPVASIASCFPKKHLSGMKESAIVWKTLCLQSGFMYFQLRDTRL